MNMIYEVRHISYNGKIYIVSLSEKECSYKRWMLTELPCNFLHERSTLGNWRIHVWMLQKRLLRDFLCTNYIQWMRELFGLKQSMLIYSHQQSKDNLKDQRRKGTRMGHNWRRKIFGINWSRCHMIGHKKCLPADF